MQKLDKKQIPQFVGLCVLSTGTFGYFGVRMVTPSPAAAATRPALKPSESAAPFKAAAPAGTAAGAPASPAADAAAPPPTPGMRDPFVVGYTDPKAAGTAPAAPPAFAAPPHGPAPAPAAQINGTPMADAQIHEQVASLPPAPMSGLTVPGFPAAPPLPAAAPALPPQKVMPLPAPPPAPPKWSVTGLLQGDDGAGVAILRDGESRRIVHVGDFVDSIFRVTRVTRSAVVLRHGKTFYTLPLGTKSEVPSAPAAPAVPAPAVPVPASPEVPPLPRQSQAAPVPARHPAPETVAFALPLRLLDGREMDSTEKDAVSAPAPRMASLAR